MLPASLEKDCSGSSTNESADDARTSLGIGSPDETMMELMIFWNSVGTSACDHCSFSTRRTICLLFSSWKAVKNALA